jgi:predicted dinucleotide-utilizing enzyme
MQVGSPTALAEDMLRERLAQEAKVSKHCLFVATGALWGALDIQKMADAGTLQVLVMSEFLCMDLCQWE